MALHMSESRQVDEAAIRHQRIPWLDREGFEGFAIAIAIAYAACRSEPEKVTIPSGRTQAVEHPPLAAGDAGFFDQSAVHQAHLHPTMGGRQVHAAVFEQAGA